MPNVALAAYSSLFVSGDSLGDAGNAYALSGGVWPPSPPYDQRFTNVPTVAEVLADPLGFGFSNTNLPCFQVGNCDVRSASMGAPDGASPRSDGAGVRAGRP